jgi:hypothetical protein
MVSDIVALPATDDEVLK